MAEMLADNEEPGEKELEAIGREIESRRERARRHPLAETSYDYSVAARRWLGEEEHPLDRRSDPALREALAIIRWDAFLIHVKTMRALTGRDEDSKGRFWKGRVQNDWNGSAKVVLISMERSERAWRTVAAASGAEAPAVLADMLAALRARMLREFPRAMAFRRPGFDDASGRPV
jgi:hypothetical protein